MKPSDGFSIAPGEKPRRVVELVSVMNIFITEDIRFVFLARKPNLISSEFWGKRVIAVIAFKSPTFVYLWREITTMQ
jgi:hypothetical protein